MSGAPLGRRCAGRSLTDGGRASVDAVLDELLCDRAEVDDDLARLDLMDLLSRRVSILCNFFFFFFPFSFFPLFSFLFFYFSPFGFVLDKRTVLDSIGLIVVFAVFEAIIFAVLFSRQLLPLPPWWAGWSDAP